MIRRYRATVEGRTGGPSVAPAPRRGIWTQPLVRGHIACMLVALGTSTLFLACYLLYHFRAGSMAFSQGGVMRVAYLSILLSHTVLATASVPLILITVRRGWRGELDRHTTIASVTFPIWLYVAVTGVVIYLLLYHLPVAAEWQPLRALIPLSVSSMRHRDRHMCYQIQHGSTRESLPDALEFTPG